MSKNIDIYIFLYLVKWVSEDIILPCLLIWVFGEAELKMGLDMQEIYGKMLMRDEGGGIGVGREKQTTMWIRPL